MTHLFLVRHAEAHSNQKAVAAAPKGDSGLTGLGRTQAEKFYLLGVGTARSGVASALAA